MKKLSLIIAAVFVFGVANTVNAKKDEGGAGGDNNNTTHEVSLTIPEITLLDIEDGAKGGFASSFNFEITPSDLVSNGGEAGAAFNSTVNLTADKESGGNTAYLQYTALVASEKTVKAEITDGSLPEGFELRVNAAAAVGDGAGQIGTSAGMQTLPVNSDGAGISLINSIESCYTGTGAGNGHPLEYQLAIKSDADIASITSGSTNITVTYTITD